MKLRLSILILTLAGAALAGTPADSKTVDFRAVGVVVDIQNFFDIASEDAATYRPLRGDQGRLALVTSSGVYAFLETPSNAAHLRGVVAGTAVELSGRLLVNGALLHIDNLRTVEAALDVDLGNFRSDAGRTISLTGTNLCQCGLDVGELPHSCALGHRHHLQADDGKIYHYLQYGEAQEAYLGIGSHFRPVAVQAKVLPGQYLLVESVKVR